MSEENPLAVMTAEFYLGLKSAGVPEDVAERITGDWLREIVKQCVAKTNTQNSDLMVDWLKATSQKVASE